MSHAVPVGQSVTDLQPQNVWTPVVMHCPPLGLAMQLTQAGTALVTPHAALEFPWVHVPALQQPPLHPRFPAHDVEHVWRAGLHACPTRHSEDVVQPPPSPASAASAAVAASPASPPSPALPPSPESVDASAPSVFDPSRAWYAPSACDPSTVASAVASGRSCCSPFTSSPHAGATRARAPAHATRANSRLTPYRVPDLAKFCSPRKGNRPPIHGHDGCETTPTMRIHPTLVLMGLVLTTPVVACGGGAVESTGASTPAAEGGLVGKRAPDFAVAAAANGKGNEGLHDRRRPTHRR